MQTSAEITINMVVSTYFAASKNGQNMSGPESTIGPSMLRNIIEPAFDSGKWSILTLFVFSHFPAERRIYIYITKEKGKIRNLGPAFGSKKANLGPDFD